MRPIALELDRIYDGLELESDSMNCSYARRKPDESNRIPCFFVTLLSSFIDSVYTRRIKSEKGLCLLEIYVDEEFENVLFS